MGAPPTCRACCQWPRPSRSSPARQPASPDRLERGLRHWGGPAVAPTSAWAPIATRDPRCTAWTGRSSATCRDAVASSSRRGPTTAMSRATPTTSSGYAAGAECWSSPSPNCARCVGWNDRPRWSSTARWWRRTAPALRSGCTTATCSRSSTARGAVRKMTLPTPKPAACRWAWAGTAAGRSRCRRARCRRSSTKWRRPTSICSRWTRGSRPKWSRAWTSSATVPATCWWRCSRARPPGSAWRRSWETATPRWRRFPARHALRAP